MNAGPIVETVRRYYPEVEAVYLFGSHGTPDAREDSDVDIALLLPPAEAKAAGGLYHSKCREELERVLSRPVDLINLRRVNTVFRHEIVWEGRIIYQRSEFAVDEFEMLTMSFYQKLNEERAEILAEIQRTGRILG